MDRPTPGSIGTNKRRTTMNYEKAKEAAQQWADRDRTPCYVIAGEDGYEITPNIEPGDAPVTVCHPKSDTDAVGLSIDDRDDADQDDYDEA